MTFLSTQPSRRAADTERFCRLAGRTRAVVAAALLAGCQWFPEWETRVVYPPPLPAAWIDCGLAPDWEVIAVWMAGEAGASIRPGACASLCLPRGKTVAILAYPVVAGARLRPAGAVFAGTPLPSDGAACTWEAGYEAEAARVLMRAGVDPACFDLKRFASEAYARLGDPWKAPPESFAARFAEGTFSVLWLNPGAVYTTSATGLPGPAASDSPFGPVLAPDADGSAVVDLCEGVSRWFAAWGRVSVEVRADGEATWLIVGGKDGGMPPSAD